MEKDDGLTIEENLYTYSTFFSDVISVDSGLNFPITVFSDEQVLDKHISERVRSLNRVECINLCAFFNMITQTQNINNVIKESRIELRNLRIDVKRRGLLFYRHSLLHLIGLKIINNTNTNLRITGSSIPTEGTKRYYESLLLANEKHKFQKNESLNRKISKAIRDYPQSSNPDYIVNLYQRCLKRYWYIYNVLLLKIEEKDKKLINQGISRIIQYSGLSSLSEYFFVIAKLFNWFLYSPKYSSEKLGFNKDIRESFYINSEIFSEKYDLIKFLKKMALGLEEMKTFITESLLKDKEKGRNIDKHFQIQLKFFEKPILTPKENLYTILDFKFLIERICSGLIWSMWELLEVKEIKIQNLKSSYGQLLEKYFHDLLFRIFGKENIVIKMTPGHSDALILLDGYILIFEFTTEYYQIYSLYNSDLGPFYKDLDKILFNSEKNKKKEEKGKLFKLNNYVSEQLKTHPNAKIIPILVTEKNLGGGVSFFKSIDFDIVDKIKENSLIALEDRLPLIISLDDLEIFWSVSDTDKKNVIKKFIHFSHDWQKSPEVQLQYSYNFGYYLDDKLQGKDDRVINSEFDEFFNFRDFLNIIGKICK